MNEYTPTFREARKTSLLLRRMSGKSDRNKRSNPKGTQLYLQFETTKRVLSICAVVYKQPNQLNLEMIALNQAVKSRELVKVYHSKETVETLKRVNVSVDKGELFTLLGPNGAGKTTFLRIISTQLLPSGGDAEVLGYSVVDEPEEVRKHIAVVPQEAATYNNFTPWEYAYYFARLTGMPTSEAKQVSEKTLKAVDLWDLKNRMCQTLFKCSGFD